MSDHHHKWKKEGMRWIKGGTGKMLKPMSPVIQHNTPSVDNTFFLYPWFILRACFMIYCAHIVFLSGGYFVSLQDSQWVMTKHWFRIIFALLNRCRLYKSFFFHQHAALSKNRSKRSNTDEGWAMESKVWLTGTKGESNAGRKEEKNYEVDRDCCKKIRGMQKLLGVTWIVIIPETKSRVKGQRDAGSLTLVLSNNRQRQRKRRGRHRRGNPLKETLSNDSVPACYELYCGHDEVLNLQQWILSD